MLKCPYDNSDLNKRLAPFLSHYPIEEFPFRRRQLYYSVCIMFRLFLAGLLLTFKDTLWMQTTVFFVSALTIINLGFIKKRRQQWLSNSFQLVIACVLFVVSIFLLGIKVVTGKTSTNKWFSMLLPITLYVSISGGVLQALRNNPC